MTKRYALPALLASLGLTVGGVTLAADEAAKPAEVMKKLDLDKDGTINKTEAEKMKGLSEIFDTADENKDGRLDAAELSKAMGGQR